MRGDRKFRYLDGDRDRLELLADIRHVRHTLVTLAESVPKDRRYEPRFAGTTLAALLAQLHLSDQLTLAAIQLALLGTPPLHLQLLGPFNRLTAYLFKDRSMDASIRAIQRHERRIADLILSLPVDKFSKPVYDPAHDVTLTVEQTMQEGFLFHWQDVLQTMQRVQGIYYEPPGHFDTL